MRAATSASLFGLLLLGPAGYGAERIPPPREVGRPGEEVRGQRLTLTAPTRLLFGQHLDIALTARQADPDPPHLRMRWDGPRRTVVLELTTDRGEVVPVALELGWSMGTPEIESAAARMRPTGPHARGPYLAPGTYRLRAAVDARKDPFDPIAWVGRVEAKPVTLVVKEVETRLTPEAARLLITDLTAGDHAVRLAAVRRVLPTDNEEVLTALVGTLADPHKEPSPFSTTHVVLVQPVAEAARRDVIPYQGPAVIGPLIAFADRPWNAPFRGVVVELLGKLGPDPRSLAFLRDLLATGSHHERYHTIQALGRIGREGIPELIRTARDKKQNDVIRRMAIEEMAHHGTAATVGPFLREALGYEESGYLTAAANVAEAVGYREALPDLKRQAEDEQGEQNARAAAIRAYAVLADRRDARELVRKLLGAKSAIGRWYAAKVLGAVVDEDDVPWLLDALSDPQCSFRFEVEHVLRWLADKPEGVGRYGDAELWRAWWRANQ